MHNNIMSQSGPAGPGPGSFPPSAPGYAHGGGRGGAAAVPPQWAAGVGGSQQMQLQLQPRVWQAQGSQGPGMGTERAPPPAYGGGMGNAAGGAVVRRQPKVLVVEDSEGGDPEWELN